MRMSQCACGGQVTAVKAALGDQRTQQVFLPQSSTAPIFMHLH